MILVAGATGYLGTEICRLLRERGSNVRALVRPTSAVEKVERLRALGVELAPGDLKDPRSLDVACRNVDTVISTASCTISRQPDYSILRPSFFVEIWLSPAFGFDVEHGAARIFGTGDQRMSWISLSDVARFTVACIDHPVAKNAVFELGGEAVSPNELISDVERRTGHPMRVERVPAEALRAQREKATDPMEHTLATLMLGYAQGDEVDLGAARELDVPIRSVRELMPR